MLPDLITSGSLGRNICSAYTETSITTVLTRVVINTHKKKETKYISSIVVFIYVTFEEEKTGHSSLLEI